MGRGGEEGGGGGVVGLLVCAYSNEEEDVVCFYECMKFGRFSANVSSVACGPQGLPVSDLLTYGYAEEPAAFASFSPSPTRLGSLKQLQHNIPSCTNNLAFIILSCQVEVQPWCVPVPTFRSTTHYTLMTLNTNVFPVSVPAEPN